MADYGDVSGGPSDQQIRDVVASLQAQPQSAVSPAVGVMPAPEVTPTMTYMAPSAPAPILAAPAPQAAAPSAPLVITPTLAAAKPKQDDWTAPVPVMTPPPVTPLGAMASMQRPTAPTMGVVLGARR